jgi:hypothetical protein
VVVAQVRQLLPLLLLVVVLLLLLLLLVLVAGMVRVVATHPHRNRWQLRGVLSFLPQSLSQGLG